MAILNLDKLRERRDLIKRTIASLAEGLAKEQLKQAEYERLIVTEDERYDPQFMQDGLLQIKANVTAIKEQYLAEQTLLKECNERINAASNILKGHKVCPALALDGEHDWKVTEIFQFSRNWKKRECRQCDTKERLGYD